MATNKYPNGMYKSVSKKQDKTAQMLFKIHHSDSMGFNFDQVTGNLAIDIKTNDNHEIAYYLDIDGNIYQSDIIK
jgi:hypothetical protein